MSDKDQQRRERIAAAEAKGLKQGLRDDTQPTYRGNETAEEEAALLRGFAAGKSGAATKS